VNQHARYFVCGRDTVTFLRKKRFVSLVLAIVGTYVLVAALVFALQGRITYPYRGTGRVPDLPGATLETIAGVDGRRVHALYAKAEDGAPTLVHFHGNGEELADLVGFVALFRARGLGVLAVEYPGYGLSLSLEPSEADIYRDAETALVMLRDEKSVPREKIVLSGQSLGTGVAVEMASRGHGSRMLLISPYTSIVDVANRYFPILPNRWLVRDRFDSVNKASAIRAPVLVVHGTDDEVIPFSLGKKLAGTFPNARFVPFEEGRHNDLFSRGGDAFVDDIAKFCRGED
jgi:alpha-beta hydrolase superfamily lysophospholipase